jgi:hypothetical protein
LTDWRSEIVRGVLVQQRLRELDVKGIWKYHLPEVAASDDEITATERKLGYRLDSAYRQFLRYANGWRSFYQDVDILGTAGLVGGAVMDAARTQLAAVEPEIFADNVGLEVADMLPVAASARQSDMFLLGLPWSKEPGVIIWFAGYLIERFLDFDEFYLSMLDYNRRQIAKFEDAAPGAKRRWP